MPSASSVDDDIAAAFAGKDPPPHENDSHIDDDIKSAFQDSSDSGQPKYSSAGTQIGHAAMDLAGSFAHGVGTLVDVGRNVGRAFSDQPTIEYGGPDSTAAALSKPFQHAPDYEGPPDAKEQARLAAPKLGDQPIVKQALDTPLGQTLSQDVVKPAADIGQAALTATGVVEGIRGMGRGPPGVVEAPKAPLTAEEVVNQSRAHQSMGAAADGGGTVSRLTPETRDELVRAGQQGMPINQTALERHSVAESLPIPQRLTRGMATGDGPLTSEEINSRRTNPEIGAHLDNLNQGLIDNIDELRREAAPQVVGNNVVDNSQSLIDSLKKVGDSRDAAITAAYKQAEGMGGNKLNMDGQSFIDDVNEKLSDPKISEFLPDKVKKSVIDALVKKGPENMTLDDYLASDKILSRAQRAAQDGNEIHAIGEIRDALKRTDVAPGTAADAKAAYEKASALAKANFDDIKTNPAYKAAYEDRSVSDVGEDSDLNKTFAQKYVLGGSRANLRRMRDMFQGDQTANETMTAVALNHLRESAGIKPGATDGSFSQHGYNGALSTNIEPRARELLQDPALIEHVQNIGKVASWEQPRAKSMYVNSSNTAVADRPTATAIKAGVGHATAAATELLPGPGRAAVKLGKVYLNARSEAKTAAAAEAQRQEFIRETTKPGAGLTHQKP